MTTLIVLLLGLRLLLPVHPASAQSPSFATSAAISSGTVVAGGTAAITASVMSGTAATALVDVEVYSAQGAKLFQQWFDDQTFAPGQRRDYRFDWAVPASTPAGTYRVVVAVFGRGWSALHHWPDRPTPLQVTTATAPGFSSTAAISSGTVVAGGTAAITASVTSATAATALVDVEVYSAQGTKLFQQWFDDQTFGSGQTRTYTLDWAVPAATPAGTYAVIVAVFGRGWSTLHHWPHAATPLTVTGQAGAGIYWGTYIDGVPWDRARLETFEQRARKHVSIVHWGQPWWHNGGYQDFDRVPFDLIRAHGAIPLLDWGPWDYCCGSEQPAFRLAEIAAGRHDAHIRRWATAAKVWGHPLFLRFGWEMNGWWQFPWSEQLNGNRPGEFVRAWRHVHALFRQAGATNVAWVWSPNVVTPGRTTPLHEVYPGDAYVDWVGMDGYNWGTDRGRSWESFAQVFGQTYQELGQLAPGKPIMIAEVASSEDGGSKAAWIRDAFLTQLPRNFPRIRAVVWFNWSDGDSALDWPIESSPASVDAFGEAVGGSGHYLDNRFGDITSIVVPSERGAATLGASRDTAIVAPRIAMPTVTAAPTPMATTASAPTATPTVTPAAGHTRTPR